ncbi:MAG: hypothetical protein EA385_12895 [Salinarimonadaceae bacterium]|nr:MAG: hypothetical protein EA385_12895 [Salinarimonadaceae bacterium]
MLIISHNIYLKTDVDEIAIEIRLYQPEKHNTAWICRYEVDWPEGSRTFRSSGFDALQALVLALQMIGAEIYSSSYHRAGRLRAYDNEKGYGFPVASSLRDLLVGVDKIAM